VNTGLGFVEVVGRASEMPELEAGKHEGYRSTWHLEAGKSYRRSERLAESDADGEKLKKIASVADLRVNCIWSGGADSQQEY